MVSDLMNSWLGNQGYELFQKFRGRKHHHLATVSPLVLEAITDLAIKFTYGQPFVCNRGSGHIPA